LQQTSTFSTLETSDQIKRTTRTEFSPTQPTFAGGSTTSPTISGYYTGSTDDVLTFRVTTSGNVGGLFSETVEVRNQAGNLVDEITVPSFYSAGSPLALSNGLSVAFSAGFLANNDSFQVSVFANVPNDVNQANPFNGTGANAPGFESGVTVSAGSL